MALAVALLFPACSVNVQKEKNGQDKNVNITTPIGGIHVSKDVDASQVGLPVYPGARLKPDDSNGDDNSANVNISGFGYGLKVIALEYESDDSPAKLVAFYKQQLLKYGKVLECHTAHMNLNTNFKSDDSRHELTCEGSSGSNVELKVGTQEDQHIVEVESNGKGSNFSLVYIRTHGKDADI
jgi:hypothetical protein